MTCDDCASAIQRKGQWHGFTLACKGCEARAVARSQAMFLAVRKGDTAELHETLRRIFPAISLDDAKRMVWGWWKTDHADEVSA